MNSKKIVLFSNVAAAGKTTFVLNAITDNYQTNKKYVPTIGVDVHQYKNLVIWDTAGDESYGGLRDGYHIMGNVGLLFAINSEKLQEKYIDFYRVTSVHPIVILIKNLTKEQDKILEFCESNKLQYKEIDNLNSKEVRDFLDTLI